MSRKRTIEFVKEKFEKEQYECLSEEYINNSTTLKYICPKGHNGQTSLKEWNRGVRCAKCLTDRQRLPISVITDSFEKEGFIVLIGEYKNNKQKLNYICPKGHKHSISWTNWSQGGRCPTCAGLKKLTIDFVRSEFKEEG